MYISRTCPHFGSDKKNVIYGNYVCNLLGKDMKSDFAFIGRYCTGQDFEIDSPRPYLQCPYFQ